MPILTYPLALLGLVSVPGLVAIYFLHRKFQRREATALFLWEGVARAEQGGRRMDRFRMPLLFFVELLLLASLALAATDLRHLSSRADRPLVLVLDDSYSMRATAAGEDARSRGLAEVAKELGRYRPTRVRVILAGAEPQVVGVPLQAGRVPSVVDERWRCLAPGSSLEAALVLAAEVEVPDARVVVVTDHPPESGEDVPGRLWVSVGRQMANAAFVAAGRNRLDAERDRCFVQVANPGKLPLASSLRLTGDGMSLGGERALSLSPGASERVAFTVPRAVGVLRAVLAADGLGMDNEVALLAAREDRVRVANRVREPALRELVARALASTGLRDPERGLPQLVVADHSLGALGGDCWSLEIRSPELAVPFTGPFVADWGHRLMAGLDFSGVVWAAGKESELSGAPVVMAGSVPLLEDREVGGTHAFLMHLNAAGSSVGRTPNWPALFWNLLSWRAEQRVGFVRNHVRLGQTTFLVPPGDVSGSSAPVQAELEEPDGRRRTLVFPSSGGVPVAGERPGVYSAVVGDRTYRFACNPLSPAEGDLSGCATVRIGGRPSGDALRRRYASGAWLFGLLACALLLWHCFLLRSRSSVPASRT